MTINTWENVAYVHLTDSKKKRSSWEANTILTGEEIPLHL
jgi:hypothetical protein